MTTPDRPGPLHRITGPADVRRLTSAETVTLAAQVREFLVEHVSRTGGHLGPNLGVVELTIALHRVFCSPRDSIVLDTGHQSYVHKLLTGRQDFTGLRARGGLSGYPSRAESEHDVVENSHASTALSWADGIARAHELAGRADRHVVAVVGDGALTGGMAWEAVNNLSAAPGRRVVVVVNDNGLSYSPTVGGVARELAERRAAGGGGRFLGLPYLGPVDGHDVGAVETALRRARDLGRPVVVHVVTEKGRGFPAADAADDRLHAVGAATSGAAPTGEPARPGWTDVFADELLAIGRRRDDVVAVTAAMPVPVGLEPFAREFPDRAIDVGIAEQHAVTSAAGMAFAGLHPVVAVYSTFLQRAFDQVLLDVALHRAGVTFVLDRAGVTGADGPSHHGQWDMAMLRVVPGLRLAAPRDEPTLRAALRAAVDVDDAPTVVRYPKGALPAPLPALEDDDGVAVLARHAPGAGAATGRRVLVVGVGSLVPVALAAGESLAAHGLEVEVVAPTWVLPVPDALVKRCGEHDLVVTVEDGVVDGGVGALLAQRAGEQRVRTPFVHRGLPAEFLGHATRAQVLTASRMRAEDAVRAALAVLSAG